MKSTLSRTLAVTTSALAVTLVAAACGNGGESGDGSSIRLGMNVDQAFDIAVTPKIAEEVGCFEAEGLDVSLVSFNGGSEAVQALSSGAVDVNSGNGFDVPSAVAKGLDIKAFSGIAQESSFVIIASPDGDVQSLEDLAGTSVGISRFGSTPDYVVRQASAAIGGADIEAVPLGGLAENQAALSRGDVDAFVWTVEVGTNLKEQGAGRVIASASDFIENDQHAALIATQSWLDGNPEAAESLASAYGCAIDWMQDPENRDRAVELTTGYLGLDPAVAERVYDLRTPALTPDGSIDAAGLETLSNALPELGLADTSPAVDDLYVSNEN
ncbi:ABC transporter substrate-binding protein [Rhodococcus rhodnii]|uniref:ABC transporter substrate-binding protein n=2 Tax=Rhodococcus rhodnii TaxID=38312 RepID=R7WJN7_9NOCA|nr:ABC transporter substrate-binding protein [Rhodococcus rhodnii]EOM75518.1 ABC transporter substrate-binding protein [Rhodococcus rhodnii LMG 5362]TXG90475.1 ABC transporter substrate-binding protein [Rhodococcus rhodnii]